MSNIFVVLSTFNCSTVKSIIDEHNIKNYKIIDPYGYIDEGEFGKVSLKLNISENNNSIANSLVSQFNKARLSKKIIDEHSAQNLFIPHFADIVTNLISSNCQDCDIYIYEDGILPYYDHKFDRNNFLINYAKKIISYLVGLKYTIYKGYLAESRIMIKGIFLRYPEMYDGKIENILKIKVEKINYDENDLKLFLGQESLVKKVGRQKYFRVLQRVITRIGDTDNLIYKPHRICGKSDLEELKKIIGNGRIMIDSTPIEEMISEIKPNSIFSFNSTSLLNLRYMLPERIKIYSCFAFSKTMQDKFKRIGIEEMKCS